MIRSDPQAPFSYSPRTRAALGAALRKIAADGADGAADLLDEVATGACADAHGDGESIERVIVAIKREWAAGAPAHGLRGRDSAVALARLVSGCIREYFRHC